MGIIRRRRSGWGAGNIKMCIPVYTVDTKQLQRKNIGIKNMAHNKTDQALLN